MIKGRNLIATTLACAVLALAPGLAVSGDVPTRAGAELLKPFKQSLKAALLEGLQAGPPQAIGVCKDRAPAIAESLSVDGVRMGRTSHRLRNPDNVGPGWVTPALAAMLEEGGAATPRTIELDNDRLGYVEPIPTEPMCLTCHGEAIAPEIAARIESLYPDDEATGFKEGDLRGVFWVEYPAHGRQ